MRNAIIVIFLIIPLLMKINFAQETRLIQNDTTWGGSKDTIYITDNITVAKDANLIIREGTTLLFDTIGSLSIYGRITAIGTLQNRIVFSAVDTSHRWNRIKLLENTNDTSIFDNCVIEYTKYYAMEALKHNYIIFSNNVIQKNEQGLYIRLCNFTMSKCKITEQVASMDAIATIGGLEAFRCKFLISENIFQSNQSSHGGAMNIEECEGIIQFNTVIGNRASYGSGLHLTKSKNCIVSNNTFHRNNYATRGGGIFIMSSPGIRIVNNIITNNAAGLGAGIYVENDTVMILNNLIANNKGSDYGGGICALDKSKVTSINNTIVNNEGHTIYAHNTSKQIFINTILWSIKGTIIEAKNSIYQNSFIGTQAALTISDTLNPLFVKPTTGVGINFDASLADWNLLDGSPCVNKGTQDTSGLSLPLKDLSNSSRIIAIIDIGAFENQVISSVIAKKGTNYRMVLAQALFPVLIDDKYNLQGRKCINTRFGSNLSDGFYIYYQNHMPHKAIINIK